MDCYMPTRIAYWTSSFEPGMEAIASEVATLRRHFRPSITWGMDHRRWVIVAPGRGDYCLNPKLHLLFRSMTRALEPMFDLNHVFGSLNEWFYLQGARRRPTILTVAVNSPSVDPTLLERVDRFVVEFESAREQLLRGGISPGRIRMILPSVDLTRFVPTRPLNGPFTVLFASSPELPSWLAARGLPQLLDAAGLRPEMRFRLLWRPWGSSKATIESWVRERGLRNVQIENGRFDDMPAQFEAAHVTLAPFTSMDRCKPMPNSLIESLACGRPVLCTPEVEIARIVREAHAGMIVPADGLAIAEGLDRLRADWAAYSVSSRKLAERAFSLERFLRAYQRVYYEVLRNRLRTSLRFSI
jgi:glycosyltransferase involved in cell wall biosynthesis